MSEEKNVPKLRFPGFTEPWEQRKLGEVATFINGRAYSQDELLDEGKYKVLRVGNFYTNDSWYYSDLELPDKFYAQEGDLLYTWSATFGPHIWHGNKVIYHYHIWKVELSDKLDKTFTLQLLEEDKANILANKNGSTMVHITKEGMEQKQISIPSSVQEQAQIGAYFEQLDNLITLHQRKLGHVKDLKKSMLQKMFPKNGELYPEVRFPGFTAAWEQRKLEDFGIATGGTSIESEFSEDGKYKVISIGSYSENSVYNDQGIRAVESEKTLKRVLNKGDLTMILNDKTTLGNIIGRALLIEKSGVYVYNQRTERIEINDEEYDSLFIYEMLNTPNIREKIIKQAQGNTQIYVNWSVIALTEYLIPKKEEQIRIGQYFGKLDKLITLHQRELDHLQLLKKGMLQQMFV